VPKKKEIEPNTPGFTPVIENYWREKLLELEANHKKESTEINKQIKQVRELITAKAGSAVSTPGRKKAQIRPAMPQAQLQPAKKPKTAEQEEKKQNVEPSSDAE
jgi:hypothetical protein